MLQKMFDILSSWTSYIIILMIQKNYFQIYIYLTKLFFLSSFLKFNFANFDTLKLTERTIFLDWNIKTRLFLWSNKIIFRSNI